MFYGGEVMQLSHIEQKLLRIIRNYSLMRGTFPDYKRLSQYTGRSEKEVKEIVLRMQAEGKLNEANTKSDNSKFIWHVQRK